MTTRVELGTLVLATTFRHPGLLAKMAATANEIATGRLILGLGCGWHEPEYRAFGFPFDHRVGRFEEAVRAIVPLLQGERVSFDARWSHLEDAVVLPPPRAPLPVVMIAANGERMQAITARFAHSWRLFRAFRDAHCRDLFQGTIGPSSSTDGALPSLPGILSRCSQS